MERSDQQLVLFPFPACLQAAMQQYRWINGAGTSDDLLLIRTVIQASSILITHNHLIKTGEKKAGGNLKIALQRT